MEYGKNVLIRSRLAFVMAKSMLSSEKVGYVKLAK